MLFVYECKVTAIWTVHYFTKCADIFNFSSFFFPLSFIMPKFVE